MKKVLAILLSLLLISGFIHPAFADEVDPYDEPSYGGYGIYGGDDEEPEDEEDTQPRTEQVKLANMIFAAAAAVSCAGWITLIVVNKKKKQTIAELISDETQVIQ